MIYAILIVLILAGIYSAYSKIKEARYNAKDGLMVKEDQALMVQENKLKQEVANLKTEIKPSPNLTPSEVEDYWSKKK